MCIRDSATVGAAFRETEQKFNALRGRLRAFFFGIRANETKANAYETAREDVKTRLDVVNQMLGEVSDILASATENQ